MFEDLITLRRFDPVFADLHRALMHASRCQEAPTFVTTQMKANSATASAIAPNASPMVRNTAASAGLGIESSPLGRRRR